MFKKKVKPEINNVELLKNKCIEIKQQINNVQTIINGHEANIQHNLNKIKMDPNNQLFIKTMKPIIAMSLKKKRMLGKYFAILQACDSVAETKLLEAKVAGNLFDNNFIAGIDKLLSDSLTGIDAITDAAKVEDLESSFDIYANIMSGDEVNNEVDSIINSILGQVKSDNPNVKEKSDFVKEMEQILKG